MGNRVYAFDVETRSLGANAFESAVELLSVQLCSEKGVEFFCKGGKQEKDGSNAGTAGGAGSAGDLKDAAARLEELIADENVLLVGFSVSSLDLPALRKFLGVEVPRAKVFDILDSAAAKKVKELYGYKYLGFEKLLSEYKMDAWHKRILNGRADELMKDPEWVGEITHEFKREIFEDRAVLRRIARGHAVSRMYDEFVEKGLDGNSDFYKYAVGDAISEYEFYVKHCAGEKKEW